MSIEGDVGGTKHLRRSEVGRRVLLESPSVDGRTTIGSARVMEMVGLARAFVEVVGLKTDGWVDFHMEGRPGGLLGREREPTDLKATCLVVTMTS